MKQWFFLRPSRRIGLALLVLSAGFSVWGVDHHVPAPGGIGDVVALTNAFKKAHYYTKGAVRILLAPGIYDLKGIKMDKSRHLLAYGMANALIAGCGTGPEQTILLGGGADNGCRIMDLYASTVTVSNLTITGGYVSGASDGGGINGSGKTTYHTLIVSNNYATGSGGGGGGGLMNGRAAYNCVFADNRTGMRGAALYFSVAGFEMEECFFTNNVAGTEGGAVYCSGVFSRLSECDFYRNAAAKGGGAYIAGTSRVERCWFTENGQEGATAANSPYYGGGLYLSTGLCLDCTFVRNFCDNGGGAYVASSSAVVRDCLFEKNRQTGWYRGAAILCNPNSPLALVSNCVFNANVATNWSGRTIISNAQLVDCAISNHVVYGAVVQNSNMTRCRVVNNKITCGGGIDLDDILDGSVAALTRTNVSCLFVGNHVTETTATTGNKIILNCTYVSNRFDGANYSGPLSSCLAWNSLFADNTINGVKRDMRRVNHLNPPGYEQRHLTNCVLKAVTAGDAAVADGGWHNCRIDPAFSFAPSADGGAFDVKSSSAAFNAGVLEAWMVPLFSDRDLAGRRRVKFGAVDVGALECAAYPHFRLIIR